MKRVLQLISGILLVTVSPKNFAQSVIKNDSLLSAGLVNVTATHNKYNVLSPGCVMKSFPCGINPPYVYPGSEKNKGLQIENISHARDTVLNRSGRVTDTRLNGIPYATVQVPGSAIGTVADSLGNYSLDIPSSYDARRLSVSSVGYLSKMIDIPVQLRNASIDIILGQTDTVYSEVVIISTGCIRSCRTSCGGYRVSKCSIIRKTADSSFVTSPEKQFRVFPNPASKHSILNIRLEEPGVYQLQLVDNAGRHIHREEFTASVKKELHQYQLPYSIAAGIHYIVVTKKNTGECFRQKLIIQ